MSNETRKKCTVKKILYILTGIILLAAASWGGWLGSGYLLSMRETQKPVIPDTLSAAGNGVLSAGSLVKLETSFTLPKYRKVLQAALTPGKGTALSLAPVIKKSSSSWKTNTFTLESVICCIRPGESGTGELTLEITPAKKGEIPERFTLKVPSLKIGELPPSLSNVPEVATAIDAPQVKKDHRRWLWGLLILPLALLLWFIFRKRPGTEKPLSLKERTLNALEVLRKEVISHNRSAREGIAGVSDLLRSYLEERYKLPASGKTTPEFLSEMEFNSAIPSQAASFLRSFLNTADMIKFAQAPCDAAAVSNAVESAVELVEHTALSEEEEKKDV